MTNRLTSLQPPLTPTEGNKLRVLLVQRVSSPGPGKQSLSSLDDQDSNQQQWLKEHTSLEVAVTTISGSGSGEILDRREYLELIEGIESRNFDLVLTEDLGRIARRVSAFHICELCEDNGVRLIAINNTGVDTANEGWREAAFFAAFFYEKDNRDKSIRIKNRLPARFRDGGAIPGLIAGYQNPTDAKHDSGIMKDPDWEPIYKEWFRKLDEDNTGFSEIADWLNQNQIPVSSSCTKKTRWDCALVGETTRNPILKGLRVHNDRQTRRINASGRYKSEVAPPEHRLTREVPHLAFFEPSYYDRVVEEVNRRNARYSRKHKDRPDPLRDRPRKRTRFPGQLIECGICGRNLVFGGHGQRDHLMCNGAREYKCWNGATVDGPLAAEKISAAVFAAFETLDDFDSQLLDLIRDEARKVCDNLDEEINALDDQVTACSNRLANLVRFIEEGRSSETIGKKIEDLEQEKRNLEHRRSQLESRPREEIEIPSPREVRQLARDAFRDLAIDSFEFADLMRKLIPRIVVRPVRSIDGGNIYLRSELRLHLTHLFRTFPNREVFKPFYERRLVVDLFDLPQRLKHRAKIMELRSTINHATGRNHTESEAAKIVGITRTAAQRAAVHRKMNQLGVQDPMVLIHSPPSDYGKMRRHKHRRYSFDPLDHAGKILS